MSYCEYIREASGEVGELHRNYHDHYYGFPLQDDNELFGRLLLEINQAGLSWTTVLKKEENFRKAFHQFDIKKIAGYKERDVQRLLSDAGIIRNRLKISAAIHNAQEVLKIQKEFGSFKNWLDRHHPQTKEEWVKLFKKHFRFIGNEIVNEFLLSTAYLPGAHDADCPVYQKVLKHKPEIGRAHV